LYLGHDEVGFGESSWTAVRYCASSMASCNSSIFLVKGAGRDYSRQRNGRPLLSLPLAKTNKPWEEEWRRTTTFHSPPRLTTVNFRRSAFALAVVYCVYHHSKYSAEHSLALVQSVETANRTARAGYVTRPAAVGERGRTSLQAVHVF